MVSLILATSSVLRSASGTAQACWIRVDSSNSRVKAFKRSLREERADRGAVEEVESCFDESEEIKLATMDQLQTRINYCTITDLPVEEGSFKGFNDLVVSFEDALID